MLVHPFQPSTIPRCHASHYLHYFSFFLFSSSSVLRPAWVRFCYISFWFVEAINENRKREIRFLSQIKFCVHLSQIIPLFFVKFAHCTDYCDDRRCEDFLVCFCFFPLCLRYKTKNRPEPSEVASRLSQLVFQLFTISKYHWYKTTIEPLPERTFSPLLKIRLRNLSHGLHQCFYHCN